MKAYFGQKYYLKLNAEVKFTLEALWSELLNKPNKMLQWWVLNNVYAQHLLSGL